ncbi:MAG TPA: glutathione S-transferase family protein [Allosphingosinicella sp.]|jgi:glutathione S-transferase
MIKLYGNPYSRANRVRWALHEAEIPYAEEQVELGESGTRSPSFLAINPNGHIPVLDDGGLVLFESVPISLYIAKRYAPDRLYAAEIQDEAKILQWSVWAITELEKYLEAASLQVTWLPAASRSADKAAAAQAEARRCLAMLSEAIASSGYLVGGRFGIADLIVTEVLTNIVHSGVDLQSHDGIDAYVRRNLSRGAAEKAFAPDVIAPLLQ